MEYLSHERGNDEHTKAEQMLKSIGFQPCKIDKFWDLKGIEIVTYYLDTEGLESDNIV